MSNNNNNTRTVAELVKTRELGEIAESDQYVTDGRILFDLGEPFTFSWLTGSDIQRGNTEFLLTNFREFVVNEVTSDGVSTMAVEGTAILPAAMVAVLQRNEGGELPILWGDRSADILAEFVAGILPDFHRQACQLVKDELELWELSDRQTSAVLDSLTDALAHGDLTAILTGETLELWTPYYATWTEFVVRDIAAFIDEVEPRFVLSAKLYEGHYPLTVFDNGVTLTDVSGELIEAPGETDLERKLWELITLDYPRDMLAPLSPESGECARLLFRDADTGDVEIYVLTPR